MSDARIRYETLGAELAAAGDVAATSAWALKVWKWQQARLELADELGLSEELRAYIRRLPKPA